MLLQVVLRLQPLHDLPVDQEREHDRGDEPDEEHDLEHDGVRGVAQEAARHEEDGDDEDEHQHDVEDRRAEQEQRELEVLVHGFPPAAAAPSFFFWGSRNEMTSRMPETTRVVSARL